MDEAIRPVDRDGPAPGSKGGAGSIRKDPDGTVWFFDRVEGQWVTAVEAMYEITRLKQNPK
ncbi:MAG TPA: hypothetical protein VI873_02705 [Candidatus Peribacteraceae bacterium]|nr:hypothetical protein [Candidatus Peribacteraceae bacterium]